MSEDTKKKLRSPEQIQQDYQQLALKAGDLQYKIVCFKKDLDMVNSQLRDLNFEYVEAQAAASAEAAQKAREEANNKETS